MDFGTLKSELIKLINRKDLSTEAAGSFIQRAIDRLERELRLPFMERLVHYTMDTSGEFVLPTDYLELINVYTDDRELEQLDMGRFLRMSTTGCGPAYFVRVGPTVMIRPIPEDGSIVSLHYYATDPTLENDGDINNWSASAVDAVLYAAGELAADFFEDERVARFAEKTLLCMAALKEQAEADSLAGPLAVAPAYSFKDE